MKKRNFYTLLSITALSLATISALQSSDAYATSENNVVNTESVISTPKNLANIAGVKSELMQSENLRNYSSKILDNIYGHSENQSVGVYKRSTDTITIYVDEKTDQTVLPTYTITPISLNRYQETAATKIKLTKGINTIKDTSEGIIHLQNETNPTAQQTLVVSVDGGQELPRFILGKTTESDWSNQLKQYPNAPGYELIGNKTLITGSKATLNYVKEPKRIIETYERIVAIHDETAGLDNSSPLHKQSRGLIQHMRETQAAGAYMYAWFYHTAYSKNSGMPTLLNARELWGPMHEFGHTYQAQRMTWDNMSEVTNNIFSLRSEKAFGQRSRLEKDGAYNKIFQYLNQPTKNFNAQTDPFLKLGMFWQLELAFGDNFYPELHKLYREEATNLSTDLAKQQYFLTSSAKIANKNLLPYFEMWGLPITKETRDTLQKYPKLTHKIWEYRDEMKVPVGPIDSNEQIRPTAPTNLEAAEIQSNSVTLKWRAGSETQPVKEYIIFRDGEEISRTSATTFKDLTVAEEVTYSYQISAVDSSETASDKSTALKVTTHKKTPLKVPAPTKPLNLVATDLTESSVILTWNKSSSSLEISSYFIYRNGVKIATVGATSYNDTNLQPSASYNYQISAVDEKNQESVKSDLLTIKTKDKVTGLSIWENTKIYKSGDKVFYGGLEYEAKWWTQNNQPGQSDVWKLITNIVLPWDSNKAYNSGDKVTFNGKPMLLSGGLKALNLAVHPMFGR
ncbi:M60 family metallopeptidase [Enterococcus rivorum]|uniref:M60 family metallopeptidase n=1 Tax=Enterococcus rivorum TaxID=762845 RepID=UPI003633D17B